MKNILNKNNKTSRIIALLLVLALIITPMMSYDGKREGAKAADTSVETYHVDVNLGDNVLKIEESSIAYADVTATSETVSFYNKATVTASMSTAPNFDNVACTWDVKTVVWINSTETEPADLGVKVSQEEMNANYADVGEITAAAAEKKVYIYVRPEVTDMTTGYSLYKTITFNKINNFAGTVAWNKISPASDATVTCTLPDKYAGIIKCGYSTSNNNDADIIWTTGTPTEEGTYYGYAGYFAAEGDAKPLLISAATAPMVIDNTAPTVSDIKLYKDVSGMLEPADAIYDESTKTYYVNGSDSDTFKYQLTITDNNGGIGFYNINGGSDTSMTEFAATSVDNPSIWTTTLEIPATTVAQSVMVKDAAGNVIENAISLPRIVAVDRSLKYTDGPKLDVEPTPGSKTNTTYTMSFTAESGNKITGYTVETKDGKVDTYTLTDVELNAQEKLPNGNYSYIANYQLPQMGVDYQDIDYVKVTVTDSADSSKEDTITADYFYDSAKPTLVKSELRQKTASDYSAVPEGPDKNGAYVIDAETTEYRYYVQIKDKGVGVTNVEGCYNSSFSGDSQKYTFTRENSEVTLDPAEEDTTCYWYYTDLAKNDLDTTTPKTLYLKVLDDAGNTTTDSVVDTGIAVIKSDKELKIDTPAVVLKKGNTVVDITTPLVEDASNSANPYKLTFQISSGYEIAKVWLNKDNDLFAEKRFTDEELNANGSGYTYDPVTKRYTATYTFDINMEDANVNEILNNMVVYGSDFKEGHQSVSASIGKLLYDNTKPIVQKIDNTDLVTELGWYNAFSFSAKIQSGPQSQSVESSITSASYTISNAVTEYDRVDLTNSIAPDGTVTVNNIAVPESAVPTGTVITFAATDKAGNTLQEPYIETVRVDNTAPTVASLKVNGSHVNENPLRGFPTVTTTVSDKLALKNITIHVEDPNGNVQTKSVDFAEMDAIATNGSVSKDVLFELAAPSGMTSMLDGSYLVKVTATDKAGNPAEPLTATFKIDNTTPIVTAKIASGTMGGKKPAKNFDGTDCDYYYRSNVGVQLTYDDDNIDSVVVTDNGKVVNVTWTPTGVGNKQVANMTVSATGRHTVKINATDKTGNKAVERQVVFVRDVVGPTISAMINGGQIYTENMGTVDITRDVNLSFSVSDANEDVNDFNYRLTKKLPDQPAVTGSYMKTTNRAMAYAEEADYTVEVYSVDMASNIGPTRNISFRVDKTAPDISISGGGNGGTSTGGVTLSFNMKEAFWWDASGNVTIYRKAGDGSTESQYKTIDYKPTAFSTAVSESLTETGTYRIEFTARDRAGHTANTTQTFTIDRDAPVITLSGVDNYDKTDKDVTFMAKVADDFYTTKKVVLSGTREDASGTKNKLEFSSFNEAGNPTVINELFQKSGIYDIQVTSEDVAGNKDTQTVHFIIDKDKPEIGKIPIEEGSVTNVFDSVIDTDELVSDLTVCDVHTYLNGVEYDGDSELEDGSYTLLITAEDELGNYSEKSVSFELDTKAPVFIVTGVEDGEVKNEAYSITVSLQIAEDTLANVELNGKKVELADNTATIEVTEKGKYTLTMSAVDKAQNYADQTITFRYGEKQNIWIWIVIGAGALLIIGGVIILIAKKRKN